MLLESGRRFQILTFQLKSTEMVKAALMFTKSGDNFNFQLKISLASESGIGNLIILSSQVVS